MLRISFVAALFISALTLVSAPAAARPGDDASANRADGLSDNFHGKVSYFGNHSGELVAARTGDAHKPSRDCLRPNQRCPVRVGGSLQVDLEFDGVVVRGSFRGSGGLRDSGLIGRRQGSQCRLFDLTDGSVWSGQCNREGFVGTVKSVGGAANQLTLSFETVATKTNDYAERARQRLAALQAARRIEFLRSVIASTDSVDDRVLASVELDSYGWTYDRLRPETMTITRRTKLRRGTYQVEVEFELLGGKKGWAIARIARDIIVCIEFWDYPGKCRAVKLPTPPAVPRDDGPEGEDGQHSFFMMPPLPAIPRAAYGA